MAAPPNSRRPHWTEEEFQAWLQKQGKSLPVNVPRETPRRNKYNNKYVKVGGETFQSEGEYHRCCELRLLERAGRISDLRRQVNMPLIVNGKLICHYRADFVYCEKGIEVVEDFKGVVTEVYALKKKLVAACYGREVRETRRPKG